MYVRVRTRRYAQGVTTRHGWPSTVDTMPSRLPNPPRPALVDTIAGLLAILGNLGVTLAEGDSPGYRPIDALAVVLMVGAGLALMWSRRAPRLVLAATTALLVLYALRDYTGGPIYLAPLFAIYSLAARDGRHAASGAAFVSTVLLYIPPLVFDSEDALIVHFFYLTWVGAALFLGEAARNRRLYVAGVEERARHLEETREEEARRRVAEERLRIARDLHDSVAHSLASISVQAGAGAHVAERRPEEAHAALVAIRQASKEALDELRSTLGMLRSAGPTARRPPPPSGLWTGSTACWPAPAAQVSTSTSTSAAKRRRPAPPPRRPPTASSRSRSPTRCATPGPPGSGSRCATGTDAVEVEVADDGMGPGDPAAVTPGHGLVGMRERAAGSAGRSRPARARPGASGSSARLPLQDADAAWAEAGDQRRPGRRPGPRAGRLPDAARSRGRHRAWSARRATARPPSPPSSSTRPDVVLMDIRMPGMDGLEATRRIAADDRLAAVRVLILTTFELDEYVFEALRAGASGFLVKDTEPVELLRAVRVVAAGEALLSPSVTRRLIGEFVARPEQRRADPTRLAG